MAFFENSYSRFIAWIKIILPITAIALLSMMFLFARTQEPSQDIPFADIDVDQLARDQRLSAPTYAGVTRDGRAVSFEAETIGGLSDGSDQITAKGVVARLSDREGQTIRIEAPNAVIDQRDRVAQLLGGVHLSVEGQIDMRADALRLNLEETHLESVGSVWIEAAFGSIQAAHASVRPKPETQGYLADFTGGVKMIYQPDLVE
jgi:lipopolysaccharide export system protein LptC